MVEASSPTADRIVSGTPIGVATTVFEREDSKVFSGI
jgi:hypothetical protein